MESHNKIEEALQSLKNDRSLELYFFERAASSSDPLKWLAPLQAEGYFAPEKNPVVEWNADRTAYTIPHWHVLGYLQNVANRIQEADSPEERKILLDILDRIMWPPKGVERVKNPYTDMVIVKVLCTFPAEDIEARLDFLTFASEAQQGFSALGAVLLQDALPAFIRLKFTKAVVTALRCLLDFDIRDGEPIARTDPYWIGTLLDGLLEKSVAVAGPNAAKCCLEVVEKLESLPAYFESLWLIDMTVNEDAPYRAFPSALLRILIKVIALQPSSTLPICLGWLVTKTNDLYLRVGLAVLSERYGDASIEFWSSWFPKLSYPRSFSPELYGFLQANCDRFTHDELLKFVGFVESAQFGMTVNQGFDRSESELAHHIAYKQKEWLSALRASQDPTIQSRLIQLELLAPEPLDHPGKWYWTETRFGDESPVDLNWMGKKSAREIAEYLNQFADEGFNGPTKEGLGGRLQEAIARQPTRFAEYLNDFLTVPEYYQYHILFAFNALLRNRPTLWRSVLLFASDVTKPATFWEKDYGRYDNYRNWICGEVATLIDLGMGDDAASLDEQLLSPTKELLLSLAPRVQSTAGMSTDVVGGVLNSPKGKLLVAMISYSVRKARIESKETDRWDADIKADFTSRLDKSKDHDVDFNVVAGEYLAKLLYLDKNWVGANVDAIFLWEQPTIGKEAMYGYLFYSYQRVFEPVYLLLKEHRHFHHALEASRSTPPEQSPWESNLGIRNSLPEAEDFTRYLIGQLCVGFLSGKDELNDDTGPMYEIFKNVVPWQIREVIRFIGFRPRVDLELDRVRELIRKLAISLNEIEDEGIRRLLLSDLASSAKFLDDLDEPTMVWLLPATLANASDIHVGNLISELVRLLPKYPVQVGQLALEIAKAPVPPSYPANLIRQFVVLLVQRGQRDVVREMKNLYLMKAQYILKDISLDPEPEE